MYFTSLWSSIALVLLTLLTFGALQWLQIPAGNFLDWLIGLASFGWLIVIVTVPWNVHFQAREVLAEADASAAKGIAIEERQVKYVQMLSRRSLWLVLALHLLSAIGLYSLAATGISAVGYVSSGAALLLSALRPTVRAYQYLATRLAMIRKTFKYPHEDVLELRGRLAKLEQSIRQVEGQLNPKDPRSWTATQHRQLEALQQDLSRLKVSYQDSQTTNQSEHQRLARDAEQAIAQLTEDSQFLNHVREIIRFFKAA
ncbi:MAG: hypothetical protein F6K19_16615 [Cyanothece sp. SIO1E1]|nr:hypothetical protein [Cyanothece sp. SIO1E1]